MAFHVFLDKKVDATILEVGIGGTYDSTNIVPHPIVTGITALGIDHINVLGKTIQDIAWQKSGIFKVHSCVSFIMFSEPFSREMFLPSLLPSQRKHCQYLKPEQWS
jgi:folylpolyglutamate synthase/dihydropteroate synthase